MQAQNFWIFLQSWDRPQEPGPGLLDFLEILGPAAGSRHRISGFSRHSGTGLRVQAHNFRIFPKSWDRLLPASQPGAPGCDASDNAKGHLARCPTPSASGMAVPREGPHGLLIPFRRGEPARRRIRLGRRMQAGASPLVFSPPGRRRFEKMDCRGPR